MLRKNIRGLAWGMWDVCLLRGEFNAVGFLIRRSSRRSTKLAELGLGNLSRLSPVVEVLYHTLSLVVMIDTGSPRPLLPENGWGLELEASTNFQ